MNLWSAQIVKGENIEINIGVNEDAERSKCYDAKTRKVVKWVWQGR